MFSVCCSSTLKRAQYQLRILVSFYLVMLHKCSLSGQSLFFLSLLHCVIFHHLFSSTNTSKFCFLHPILHFLSLSPLLLLSFLLRNPSQCLCPPCTSLLICLSSTDCPGLQWRTVLPPWLCCKYLICTSLLHEPCCVSMPLCSLLNRSPTVLNRVWGSKLLVKHLCFYCLSNLTEQI